MLNEFSNCLPPIHSYITAYSFSRPSNRTKKRFQKCIEQRQNLNIYSKSSNWKRFENCAKADLMRSRRLAWMECLGRHCGRVRVRSPGGPRQQLVTRSPIELFWTAKKKDRNNIHPQVLQYWQSNG